MTVVTSIFERAADMIETGWCQHAPAYDHGGNVVPWYWGIADKSVGVEGVARVCLTTAIHRAIYFETGEQVWDTQNHPMAKAIAYRLVAVAPWLIGKGGPEWNDAPERTQAEVVAVLRAASKWSEIAPTTALAAPPRSESDDSPLAVGHPGPP